MNTIRPTYLNQGDKIMLVAPSRFALPAVIQDAASAVLAAGFTPITPPGLDERDHQFGGSSEYPGGSDAHRAELLNSAFRDPSIRAVFALRGGYGSGRLLPLLDSTAYISDPKWIIGFSDITTLHAWSTNLGIASLHAPVATTLNSTRSSDVDALWSTLRGDISHTPDVISHIKAYGMACVMEKSLCDEDSAGRVGQTNPLGINKGLCSHATNCCTLQPCQVAHVPTKSKPASDQQGNIAGLPDA